MLQTNLDSNRLQTNLDSGGQGWQAAHNPPLGNKLRARQVEG